MLEWIKQLLIYALLIGGVIGAVIFVPKMFSKVAVSEGYNDIPGIEQTSDYGLDPSVTLAQLRVGDGIAWRLPSGASEDVGLGWFAGGPGDVVEINAEGKLLVNGTAFARPGLIPLPPSRLVVPAGYFFAVTALHQLDSIAHGPFAQAILRGRVRGLP